MFWSKKTTWNVSVVRMIVAFLLAIGIGNARADFIFGEPVNLGPTVNSSAADPCPSISADGLELYFESYRSGGYGQADIWVTTRPTIDDEWGAPTNLGSNVNTQYYEGSPSISSDGLSLYMWGGRPGNYGNSTTDIWVTRRATKNDEWGVPEILGSTVNSTDSEYSPAISFDGLQLFFCDLREAVRPGGFGGADLWMSARPTVFDPWGPPVNLGSTINSSADDKFPKISSDDLMLSFDSERPGGEGNRDIWAARRATADGDWNTPVNLGPTINGPSKDCGPSISADGRTLYFYSDRPGGCGGYDLWQAPIEPVIDFNSDGIVDSIDMCIMVDHWGTDDSLCDIGPMPWGDGVVDIQDLIVLAEHLFEEVPLVQ